MNKIYFIGFLLFSFIFTQCADMNKLDCMFSEDCEWDENIVTGNCGSFSSSSTCSNIDECNWVSTQQTCPNITGYSDCVAIPGCSYSWLTYTCGGSTSVTYCSGGSYEFDDGSCTEILMPECTEMNQFQCSNDSGCEWMENIEIESCSSNNQSECLEQDVCYWYPGGFYLGAFCSGGSYEVDNSYCQENLDPPTCSEMNELECSGEDECDWIENIDYQSCGIYTTSSQCWQVNGCYWYSGSYYSAFQGCNGEFEVDNSYCEKTQILECSDMSQTDCNVDNSCDWVESSQWYNCSNFNSSDECNSYSEYGCYTSWNSTDWEDDCLGGSFTIDNSYCEDMEFIPGDTNQDFNINVLDVIMIVNLILEENQYNELADLNNDGVNNIQDIIMVVQIILNG
tara:strand:- start:47 stop:1234 length:1188 start_codon:yes stop_codon:yes gene_type:complete